MSTAIPPSVVPILSPPIFPNSTPPRTDVPVVPPPPRSFVVPAVPVPPLVPDILAPSLPVTPPIPPTVQTGDVITAQHENTVTTSLSDLWTDVQALAAQMLTDPTTTKGDLVIRGASALTRLPVGATNGFVLQVDSSVTAYGMKWAAVDIVGGGGVPATRRVIAGTGMSGGGPLSADVTLNAAVTSVFGRTGAVVLTQADISTAGGVPSTTQVIAGAGMSGGGTLTGNVTLTAAVISVFGRTGAVALTRADLAAFPFGPSGASHSAGVVPDPGATAGTTKFLCENGSWATPAGGSGGGGAVDSVFGRTGAVVATAGDYTVAQISGAAADPTTNIGDLSVRGPSGLAALPAGTNGFVLTADSASLLGVKWAAAPVTSVFGRTGAIAATTGDYTAAMVTNAVSTAGSYADPAWITSLAWSKISGAPATGGTPAAPLGSVQFNNAGAFGGSGNLFWDAANTRLGIGTSAPFWHLHVSSASGPTVALLEAFNASAYLQSRVAGGTRAAPTATPANTALLTINPIGYDGTAYTGGTAQMQIVSEETYTPTASGGRITFATTTPGTIASAERMRITGAGNVGIGTAAPTAPLHVSGTAAPLALFKNTSATPAIEIQDSAATPNRWWLASGLGTPTDGKFGIYDARQAVNRVCVDTAGNVGIGTISPNYRLEVHPATNMNFCVLSVGGTEVSVAAQNDAHSGNVPMNFYSSLFTFSAGNVVVNNFLGIGISPIYPLHVKTAANVDLAIASGVSVSGAACIQAANDAWTVNIPLEIRATFTSFPLGNVGIGAVASSGAVLQIYGSANHPYNDWVGTLQLQQNNNANYRLCLGMDSNYNSGYVQATTGANVTALLLNPAGGSVGIHTPAPLFNLEIYNPAGPFTTTGMTLGGGTGAGACVAITGNSPWGMYFGLQNNGNTWIQAGRTDTATAYQLCLQGSGGNVAIGNFTPGYRLDVTGDVNCSGAFRVNGVPLTSGGITTYTQPSRALNTVYQNSTGKPVFLTVNILAPASGSASMYCDSGNPPNTAVCSVGNTGTAQANVFVSGWVLPGYYYRVLQGGGASILSWHEWY